MLPFSNHLQARSSRRPGHLAAAVSLMALLMLGAAATATAATATEIDARVNGALEQLYERSPAARELGSKASGILVFPRIIKAGFGLGGEFGEGSLLVGGSPVQYYRVAGASVGFQIGGQARAQVLMFMTEEALAGFQASNGWEVGVDGSVALVEFGVGEALTSHSARDPIIGFVFGNKGLMYNLSLEGSRFWKVDK
jgi:lipid-binding SYLF domain-containing protein